MTDCSWKTKPHQSFEGGEKEQRGFIKLSISTAEKVFSSDLFFLILDENPSLPLKEVARCKPTQDLKKLLLLTHWKGDPEHQHFLDRLL